MDKTKLQTLKGFRDFLPRTMAIRSRVIKTLKEVFESFGFDELQTPTLEYQEILLGKYGEEAEKLMYLFKDPGDRGVGLKYDLTVPLARVVGQYPEFPKPFKRYQIQPVFRAENTQKGRYREVYQCDVDIIGSSTPLADAEILAIISIALEKLGFEKFKIRVNSRQVLFATMKASAVPEDKYLTTIQSIDKLDKKSESDVRQELADKGLELTQIDAVFNNLSQAQADDYLKQVITQAQSLGAKNITFDPILARGLDYYTGSIFETVVEEPKIGSITGGGRYDNLIKDLGGPDLPAVGTTLGLDRIVDVIEELNLWPDVNPTNTNILVTVFSPDLLNESLEISSRLRLNNIPTEIYLNPQDKLDKQLKYADQKGIPFAVIIGSDEIEKNLFTVKDLRNQTQEQLSLAGLISKLSS